MIQDQVLQEIKENIAKIQAQLMTLTGIVVDTRETMKEQMVTKSEFQNGKSELFTHINGFIKLQER